MVTSNLAGIVVLEHHFRSGLKSSVIRLPASHNECMSSSIQVTGWKAELSLQNWSLGQLGSPWELGRAVFVFPRTGGCTELHERYQHPQGCFTLGIPILRSLWHQRSM